MFPLNPLWSSSTAQPLRQGGPSHQVCRGDTPEDMVPKTPSDLHAIDYLIFAWFHFFMFN